MAKFLIRRVIFVFVALIGATAVVFALSRMAGDPVLLYAKPSGYGSEDYLDNLRASLTNSESITSSIAERVILR